MNEIVGGIRRLMEKRGGPLKLMEVCGTHTVAIFRHGVRDIIPPEVKLISGPGCPVCVTSLTDVDAAIALARMPGVVLATFGDMMRVPGGKGSLNDARATGADVRVFYSPADALKLAKEHPEREVVFFATGFETTSPLFAATVAEAERKGIGNFSLYTVHKLVPPALKALLDSGEVRVDGFILPGHVSAIIGRKPYEFIAEKYGKAGVITGFGAEDIIEGIFMLLVQTARKRAEIEIQYAKVVREEGNPRALSLLDEYFEPCDAYWRGIGTIPGSGLRLRERFADFDAMKKFRPEVESSPEPEACSCGEILKGVKTPVECPLFGAACTPESPVGACMVSTEGSCAAYYRYGAYRG
ncbi:MAG: hydrogenase formation protein HypD [Nitrospirae bacterium]|nr:hydrogenase formation protein HypD [Nitrospirota bacterium]